MFTALLAVMLVTVSPVVSANPSAGLTSLAPQLQKRIHGQSTIVHFPATTSWSSQPVTALSIVETPHVYSHEDMTCPAQCPWIPAVPLTIDAGVPHRWFVVEQGISDAASSSSKSASGVDVQPSGGSHEQCTNGSSIALDNLTSWINGHHAQNGVVSDVDFQSEILQPILVTNSVLHHPRLTFIKDQMTVLRFLVGWIGVGALCYAVGSLSLSSFATGSVKRCSFVVEITCDHAVAGSSSLQQSDSFLSKEWRDKQKAIASGPFLLRMRDLCVSALDVVVAFILWFGNLCREVRQGRQKAIPAEIFLVKTPAFSSFALFFAMAFFRLHRMHVWKARTPISSLRICNDLLRRNQSQNLDIRQLLRPTRTQIVDICNVYPAQALWAYSQQDNHPSSLYQLSISKNSATTKQPLVRVLDPEAFVFALEQALRVPKYRKLAVQLMKPYMKNDSEKLKQLSIQIKGQKQYYDNERDQINLYWQEKLFVVEHKATTAIQEFEDYRINSQNEIAKMKTDHKRTLKQERDKARSAEDKAASAEEEKTKMAVELRRRDCTIYKQLEERKKMADSHNFDSGIMEIKLETWRGKVSELQAEARIKDQANTANLGRIRELEAEVRFKDEACSLLRSRLDRSQKSGAMKNTNIAKLTTTVEELEQDRNELKEAKKEIARPNGVIDAQPQQDESFAGSKAEGTTAVGSFTCRSEDCNPALDAKTSLTEDSKTAATPETEASISPPDSLVPHGLDISQCAGNQSWESWDDDLHNSNLALTAPVPLVLESLPKSRTIADMLNMLYPSEDFEPALSVGSQFAELSSESSIAEKTRASKSSDTTETLSGASSPTTEASNKGLLVDSTSCTSSDLYELSGKDTEDLLQLAMPETFSSWSQSTFDAFTLEHPMDAVPVIILPSGGRYADLSQSHEWTVAQTEPPVVTSNAIFDMDTGAVSVRLPGNTSNQKSQAEETKDQEETTSPTQVNLRPSHKKHHYRNRGGRPVGSSGLHSSLAISRASFGP